MTTIDGYSYFDGTHRVYLEAPTDIVGDCEDCDGWGECMCCGHTCDTCDGRGKNIKLEDCSLSYAVSYYLRQGKPELADELTEAANAITRQQLLLKKRYGEQWDRVKTVRDYWVKA